MPKTKTKLVIEHLWKYGSITATEASVRYDVTNLSYIIQKLREDGCEIKKERLNAKGNQYVYRLNREVEDGQE